MISETLKMKKMNKELSLRVIDLEKEIKVLRVCEASTSQLDKVKVSLSDQLIVLARKKSELESCVSSGGQGHYRGHI